VNDNNVMALHSRYATVMWDDINRVWPIGKEGTRPPDEVGALANGGGALPAATAEPCGSTT